jgi:hypothetical protein
VPITHTQRGSGDITTPRYTSKGAKENPVMLVLGVSTGNRDGKENDMRKRTQPHNNI